MFSLEGLLGEYLNTNEDFGVAYGPYTTRITSVNQTSATTGSIVVENIFDYGWGPITFNLDWTDSSNKIVTLQQQFDIAPASTVTSNPAYSTWNVMVDASPTLGPGTFSFENQTLKLNMRVGLRNPTPPNQADFSGTPYIVNMAR